MSLFTNILNASLLVTLVLALGLSGAAFGLFAHNNISEVCLLNITLDESAIIAGQIDGNHKLCNTSLAGYIIASICIAVVTMMEFNRLVYGRTANIAGKILQIILLLVSIVFLLISGISVAVGWAKTCKTIKDATDGLVTCNDDGSRYLNQEMFGSAICAWVSLSFTAVAIQFAVVKSIMEEKGETRTDEEEPLIHSSH